MGRNQFTFYRSFWEALRRLPQRDRISLFDAICAYALDAEERSMTPGASAAFILIRPNLDAARRKSDGSKSRGSKQEDGEEKAEDSGKIPESKREDSRKIPASKAHDIGKTSAARETPEQEDGGNKKEKEKEIEIEKEIENECYIYCPEPSPAPVPPAAMLPLNDGTEYPISREQCAQWAKLYPAVDVMQQMRNMVGWLNANPARRKTASGVLRFVNSWLAREQNRGGAAPERTSARGKAPDCDGKVSELGKAAIARLLAEEGAP